MAGDVVALMEPWWEQLRALRLRTLAQSHAFHLDKRYDGLVGDIFGDLGDSGKPLDAKGLETVGEALDLVALLAYADEDAWLEEVIPSYDWNGVFSASRSSYLPPKFVFQFEEHRDYRDETRLQQTIAFLFKPLALHERSEAFRTTRQRLLSLIRDPTRRRECETLTVAVRVQGSFIKHNLIMAYARAVDDVNHRGELTKAAWEACMFALEASDLGLSLASQSGENEVELGTILSASAVPFRRL